MIRRETECLYPSLYNKGEGGSSPLLPEVSMAEKNTAQPQHILTSVSLRL